MLLPEIFGKEYKSYSIFHERDFLERRANNFDSNIPLIIYNIRNKEEVIQKVKKFFGNPNIEQKDECIIVVPKDFMQRSVYSFSDLIETIKRLRDRDGCQWDREQTNMSIRGNAIEEAYELVEAIELNDTAKMVEECGDVILQGLFNAIIAEESKRFSVIEVIDGLCKKLITRHTHIFGKEKAKDCQEALNYWEQAKAKEKNQKTVQDKINAVPRTFGALMRALKVQKIVKKTGFEFSQISDAEKKIYEEWEEFKTALSRENREEEAGDLLFSVVNILRMYGIDPEVALNATTEKFIKRFHYIEEMAIIKGKQLEECTLEEMESWYQQSKKNEE